MAGAREKHTKENPKPFPTGTCKNSHPWKPERSRLSEWGTWICKDCANALRVLSTKRLKGIKLGIGNPDLDTWTLECGHKTYFYPRTVKFNELLFCFRCDDWSQAKLLKSKGTIRGR